MKVVVALINDYQQRVLITQRALHQSHGGFWEFPGGKIEPDETALSALIREVKEEVGLDVIDADFLYTIDFTYPYHTVELWVYQVTDFKGNARCCEAQIDLRWVEKTCLDAFQFPEANQEIIRRLSPCTSSRALGMTCESLQCQIISDK